MTTLTPDAQGTVTIPGLGTIPASQASQYGYTVASNDPTNASAAAPFNVTKYINAVQTGQMTQAQAYQAALSAAGNSAREGGTVAQQQEATAIKQQIYGTNRTYTPTTTSTSGPTGTTSSTVNVAPQGGNSQANIYNPTTGKTGYQVSGASVPSGWQSIPSSGVPTTAATTAAGTAGFGSTTGANGTSGPNITPTGNSTLDQGVQGAIQYVTGSLESGYKINPSLTAANIQNMLPQFIQETTQQLEPQLQQNLQQTFLQAGQTIQSLAASYTANQTADVQAYQKSLSQIMQGAPSPGQTQAMQYLTTGTNQSLAALDASAAQQIGSTAQTAGAQLGTGGAALQGGLNANGIAGMSGLNGYSASDLMLPSLTSETVGMGGPLGSQYAGSPQANSLLNFQYNPSIYTSGSIPQAFDTAFSQGLNQNVGNYQNASAQSANPTPTNSAAVSSNAAVLPNSYGLNPNVPSNSVAQGSSAAQALGWYTGANGSPVMNS